MRTYTVIWQIEVDAETPQDAASEALKIQRDNESMATVFDVREFGSTSATKYQADLLDGSVERVG